MGLATSAEFSSTMFVGKHNRINNLHPFALDRLRETFVIFSVKMPVMAVRPASNSQSVNSFLFL